MDISVSEWSTLIGRDCRDTVLSLVEPYYAGAKVYAITTQLKASKIPTTRAFYQFLCFVMASMQGPLGHKYKKASKKSHRPTNINKNIPWIVI